MAVLTRRDRPRRAPWPDDGIIGTLRCRLGYADRGGVKLVTEVPPDQSNVAPTAFGETADNPIFGQVYAYRDLSRGYGETRLRAEPTGRYAYCVNADPSAGPWLKGPELTAATPGTLDATTGITRWFEVASRLYAVDGRYVLDGGTDGTGWTVAKDFGVDKAAVDVLVVQTNQAASVRYAWVGMGDTEKLYTFDGTTWTQHATLVARAWAVNEDTLFRVDDANRLNVCDLAADPLVADNWAAPTDRIGRVGPKDAGVVRMALDAAGGLLVAAGDDLYTMNDDGSVNRLFGAVQFAASATNGRVLARWGNNTFTTYGDALHRLAPDGGLTHVGPELLPDNDTPVRGRITAAAGTDFGFYAAIFNPDTGNSHLLKSAGESVTDARGRRLPVWHGSLTPAFVGVSVTSMHQSAIGAPGGHKRLYLGMSDGTIRSFVLPCTTNPAACSSYRFSIADGEVYLPRTAFYFPREIKAFHRVTGEADNWSGTNSALLSYKTDNGTVYTPLGERWTQGEAHTVDFPDSTQATYLDPLVTLSSLDPVGSPQVSGVAVEFRVRPKPRAAHQVFVLAEDGLRTRQGTPYRRTGDQIEAELEAMAEPAAGTVPFVGPDEENWQVTLVSPRATTAYDRDGRPRKAVAVQLIAAHQNPTDGVLANLEGYTLAQLEQFTLDTMEDL